MKKAATKALTKTLFWFGIVVIGFTVMMHSANGSIAHEDASQGKPLAVGSPAEIATHFNECWNSGNHGEPRFVIYRPVKGGDWKVGGAYQVHVALEQMFNRAPQTIVIHAFCVGRK